MFYAKLENEAVKLYPYTLTDLRYSYPNTSFPESMTDDELKPFDVVPVEPTEQPAVDYTKNISRWAKKSEGGWVETWTVTDASQQEIDQRLKDQWHAIRQERDAKLYQCDWTQLPDVPLTAEQKQKWVAYRQALRDVTNQPNPFNIVWPVAPQA